MSAVTRTEEWPSRSDTVAKSKPSASKAEAWPWRSVRRLTPFGSFRRRQRLDTDTGLHATIWLKCRFGDWYRAPPVSVAGAIRRVLARFWAYSGVTALAPRWHASTLWRLSGGSRRTN